MPTPRQNYICLCAFWKILIHIVEFCVVKKKISFLVSKAVMIGEFSSKITRSQKSKEFRVENRIHSGPGIWARDLLHDQHESAAAHHCLCNYSIVTFMESLYDFVQLQGFVFRNSKEALNCSPERFKESLQESDSNVHHWIVIILGELNIALLRED